MADLEIIFKPTLAVLAAIAGALLLTVVLRATANRVFRKVPDFSRRSAQAKYPVFGVLVFIGIRMALAYSLPDQPWFAAVDFVLMLGFIAALVWLALATLSIAERLTLRHFRANIRDNKRMRRLTTQITLGRRIVSALLITIAVAGLLLTIPEVRALGTGLLASAGLISIVAGLAVQSSLSNVFAGVQLAFTDAIRIDDVVVVEGLWGTEIKGTVEMDLDWHTPVADLRAYLDSVLAATPLWDGRTGKLEVTDAVNSLVRIRIVVSAKDSDALWDLRCLVRESMMAYVQTAHEGSLPRQRWEMISDSSTVV